MQGCNLGGTWIEGFLRCIVHNAGVTTISGKFDALTEIQPVVVGVSSSDLLGFVPGPSLLAKRKVTW